MNIAQIEQNVRQVLLTSDQSNFIYDLLTAYGKPKASITRLAAGEYNLSKDKTSVLWKSHVFFSATNSQKPSELLKQMKLVDGVKKHKPRFLLATDYEKISAYDTKTGEDLEMEFVELGSKFDFFLPWAGMEKSKQVEDSPADVKAAEKMAKLYDLILDRNPVETVEDRHRLNVFLSRLLFCYFAEDTEIFKAKLFSKSIESHTSADGTDLTEYLQTLFSVLNQEKRDKSPVYMKDFPYVNGGLFAQNIEVPKFDKRSRDLLIKCGLDLNWSEINPDIFGSMFQAVVDVEQRGSMGMHYTSVANIMKVIEPLFLNGLYEELQKNRDSEKRLQDLQRRISRIKVFDPACGSGNFLIIAYKELRRLEMDIFNRLSELNHQLDFGLTGIQLSQFFGIELDDFAHEIAMLSLWLAEHQMNMVFMKKFGKNTPTLPLKPSGKIVCANATRADWKQICPISQDEEIYVLGNPPYLGSRRQSEEQTADLIHVFGEDYKSVDYIFAWFVKAAAYISGTSSAFAFVSTNSICQGEQVALGWPLVLEKNLEIFFAHTSFVWSNSAKKNAKVVVIIIGVKAVGPGKKIIYRNSYAKEAKQINPYLADARTVYVHSRSKQIAGYPEMNFGNMPADGGKLLLTTEQKIEVVQSDSRAERWIKPFLSAKEYLNGSDRWCIWLEDVDRKSYMDVAVIAKRVIELKKIREASSRPQLAAIPHLFAQITQPKGQNFILIPCHSSSQREYIPMGLFTPKYVAGNSCLIIASHDLFLYGVLMSRMHMVWVDAVCGRIKQDFRYSKDIVYNNYPFPSPKESFKAAVRTKVLQMLSIREAYSEKSLSDLYDVEDMPDDLRKSHHELDIAVEQCFRISGFADDEERLSYIFNQYLEMS
ncbi:MAG: N-6 DNA methylase [Polaromonas sp.]|uniref:DNA methyltransferase n=1 Tax=Polaromonas sp. TaxID=1869339 RepID=UPI00248A6F5B|nr:DNA methyltransferase [Polaromonas sp.]MDI1238657.1 N-6 DNA methylase [Polaromonas sp.]